MREQGKNKDENTERTLRNGSDTGHLKRGRLPDKTGQEQGKNTGGTSEILCGRTPKDRGHAIAQALFSPHVIAMFLHGKTGKSRSVEKEDPCTC